MKILREDVHRHRPTLAATATTAQDSIRETSGVRRARRRASAAGSIGAALSRPAFSFLGFASAAPLAPLAPRRARPPPASVRRRAVTARAGPVAPKQRRGQVDVSFAPARRTGASRGRAAAGASRRRTARHPQRPCPRRVRRRPAANQSSSAAVGDVGVGVAPAWRAAKRKRHTFVVEARVDNVGRGQVADSVAGGGDDLGRRADLRVEGVQRGAQGRRGIVATKADECAAERRESLFGECLRRRRRLLLLDLERVCRIEDDVAVVANLRRDDGVG